MNVELKLITKTYKAVNHRDIYFGDEYKTFQKTLFEATKPKKSLKGSRAYVPSSNTLPI